MNVMTSLFIRAVAISPTSYSFQSATNSLNNILTGAGKAVGAIIAVVGLVKLMLSLADQNAVSKQQSSMLIGVGIFFLSISVIVSELNIVGNAASTAGATNIAKTIISILGKMLTWSGALLCSVATVMLTLSIAQEQAEQKAEASKLLGTGIGLLSISSAASAIAGWIGSPTAANGVTNIIIAFIGKVATYIGGGLIIMAAFHLVQSIREEDSREKATAIRFFMAGIGLVSIKAVLSLMGLSSGLWW